MKRLVAIAGILLMIAFAESAQGANGWGGQDINTQCPPERQMDAVTLLIAESFLNACMTLPHTVHRSDIDSNGALTGYASVQGVINIAGPDVLTAGAASFSHDATIQGGCTFTTPDADGMSVNLVAGTGNIFFFNLFMTGEYCTGYIISTVEVSSTVIGHFIFAINIRPEQPYENNFFVENSGDVRTYLCDASTSTEPIPESECTAPVIENRGSIRNYLCDSTTTITSPIPPSECTTPQIIVHQDPIGDVNVTINGNVSVNQTNMPPQPEPGFDGSLYILIIVFAGALAWLGETRRDNIYRLIAGGIFAVAPFVMLWELQRLGFNNVMDGYGLGFALPFMLIHWALAGYLMVPKSPEPKEAEKQ